MSIIINTVVFHSILQTPMYSTLIIVHWCKKTNSVENPQDVRAWTTTHCWYNTVVICKQPSNDSLLSRWCECYRITYNMKMTSWTSSQTLGQSQQQPNPDCWLTGVLVLILMFACASAADAAGPTRAFISAAIVTNACSTFVAFLALVSRNGMRSWSAYSCRYRTCDCNSPDFTDCAKSLCFHSDGQLTEKNADCHV